MKITKLNLMQNLNLLKTLFHKKKNKNPVKSQVNYF